MRRLLSITLLLFVATSFGQVNLTLGLRAHYPFNGNANDVSGNNNNPVFNNATLTADRFGNPNQAYSFNGIDQFIRIPNSPSINTNNQLSLCAWVGPLGFYLGACHGNSVMMKGDSDYEPGNYFIRYDDGAYTNYQNCSTPVVDVQHENFYGHPAAVPPPGYTPYIQTGEWQSVIVTFNGTEAKIYINCVLKGTKSQDGATFTNGYDLFIGTLNNFTFPYWLNGELDDIRIYDRAINQSEVNVIAGCANQTAVSGVINDYTPVTAFNPCDNSVLVGNANAFDIGDTVIIIQMKGAKVDSTNTASFGNIAQNNNAGNYEYNYISAKSGNRLTLKNVVTRSYDIGPGKVQLVRVPYYSAVTVTSNLTAPSLEWRSGRSFGL